LKDKEIASLKADRDQAVAKCVEMAKPLEEELADFKLRREELVRAIRLNPNINPDGLLGYDEAIAALEARLTGNPGQPLLDHVKDLSPDPEWLNKKLAEVVAQCAFTARMFAESAPNIYWAEAAIKIATALENLSPHCGWLDRKISEAQAATVERCARFVCQLGAYFPADADAEMTLSLLPSRLRALPPDPDWLDWQRKRWELAAYIDGAKMVQAVIELHSADKARKLLVSAIADLKRQLTALPPEVKQ
jgi:hypothetical protein